jgi:hypothetical protein
MLSLVELADMSALGRAVTCFDCAQIEADMIPHHLCPGGDEMIVIQGEDRQRKICVFWSSNGTRLEALVLVNGERMLV